MGNVLLNGGGAGPGAPNGLDCGVLWAGGQTFGNDQWAQATVNTVAANTATLSITAAAQSGGNTTYTYTTTQGSIAANIIEGHVNIIVSGMQNSGNNGPFNVTSFGAGTFTVANASGVTESGSTGTGTCPSDSGAGVVIRGSGTSVATLTGYLFHWGTNSFDGGGRVAYYELWKVINGAGTILIGSNDTTLGKTLPSPGDVYALSVVGTQLTVYKNGAMLTGADAGYGTSGNYTIADSSISSGVPGMWTFAVGGPSEYDFTLWSNNGTTQFAGNNGTTIKNFIAYDLGTIPAQSPLASDAFNYANGDLATANANWVYQGTSQFQIASHVAYKGPAGQALSLAYRSDVTPGSDQYAQTTAVATASSATQNCGPAVRVSTSTNTAYVVQFSNDILKISKIVAGTLTQLASAGAAVTGDVIVLYAIGPNLILTQNGAIVASAVDGSITSGSVGIFGAGNATANGFSAWAGGNIVEPSYNLGVSSAFDQLWEGKRWQGPQAH